MSPEYDPITVPIENVETAFERLEGTVREWRTIIGEMKSDHPTVTLDGPVYSFGGGGYEAWDMRFDPFSSGCDDFRAPCEDLEEIIAFLCAICKFLNQTGRSS